ncbi:uncharacterized protein LOC123379491 [Felis catus]|uniref:uncharacterized protein LOC123379491 n=1 Tax=Felis catus TaxID=9685 RepID=UPI00094850C6|nr:uncharacterized protein LOC123379491 [Felis catus]
MGRAQSWTPASMPQREWRFGGPPRKSPVLAIISGGLRGARNGKSLSFAAWLQRILLCVSHLFHQEALFPCPLLPESPGGTDEAQISQGRASKPTVSTQRAHFAGHQSLPELKGTLDAHGQTLSCYTETAQKEVTPPNPRRGDPCASAIAFAPRLIFSSERDTQLAHANSCLRTRAVPAWPGPAPSGSKDWNQQYSPPENP